jgi:predicted secreted protein
MKRGIALLIGAAISVVLLAACSSEESPSVATEDTPLVVVADSLHKNFQVEPSDLMVFSLSENPTTGYQWEFTTSDESVATLHASDYREDQGVGVGRGGVHTFTVKAEGTGIAAIGFKLRRNWEPEDATIARLSVTIQVHGG